MHCIVPCERTRVEAFRQGSDKEHALFGTQLEEGSRGFSTGVLLKVCTVWFSDRGGKLRLFDRGLTKSMHCIVHSGGFSTGFCTVLYCTVLYSVRIGKSRVFNLGLTKRMYSVVPSDRRGAACGVRRGSN